MRRDVIQVKQQPSRLSTLPAAAWRAPGPTWQFRVKVRTLEEEITRKRKKSGGLGNTETSGGFVIVSFLPVSTEEDWHPGWAGGGAGGGGVEGGGGLLGVGSVQVGVEDHEN